MVHKTKGIVLRAVKYYGETSLIVTIFTELRRKIDLYG